MKPEPSNDDLREALAHYDDTPRIESRYKPAIEKLRAAALAAGMPRYFPSVVEWSRNALQHQGGGRG